MWDAIKEFLLSVELWSSIFWLISGAIAGGIVSVTYTLRALRPKLITSGTQSGGGREHQSWRITILNRPSFLGQHLDGESAREVIVHIQLNEKRARKYPLYWQGNDNPELRITIEPGEKKTLSLFEWSADSEGYYIVDSKGEPVARFQTRENNFILTLRDRLERETQMKFRVAFDDTHLQNAPRLQILYPITLSDRMKRVRDGLSEIKSAFARDSR